MTSESISSFAAAVSFAGEGWEKVTDLRNPQIPPAPAMRATFAVSGASPSSVPEIDPNSLGSVLALVLGSLGLLERRRLKAA
jgi:hypothetical protein